MRIMAKTAAQMRNASKAPLSLKVTLYGIKPPVWRRLLIPGEMTLGDLHQAIQAAMGWVGGHLHAFDIAGRQYGDPDSLDEVADEERLTLNKVLNTGVSRFTYTYFYCVTKAGVWTPILGNRRRLPVRHVRLGNGFP